MGGTPAVPTTKPWCAGRETTGGVCVWGGGGGGIFTELVHTRCVLVAYTY